MKMRLLSLAAACALAFGAWGCGAECDCVDDVPAYDNGGQDAGDVVTPEDATADSGRDVAPTDTVIDMGGDQNPGDVPPEDAANDTGGDALPPDECQTEYDCTGCQICTEVEGVKKCMATPEAGVKECYSDDECTDGNVCHSDVVGKPECGGYCGPDAQFALHEWGVNVVTLEGTSKLSAGPERYYGAVVAKPVIYIYSDNQFKLDVRVTYASGQAAETWPEIPLSENVVWEGIDVGTTECTTTPTPEPDMSGMSEVEPLEIYDLPDWVVGDANCLTYGDTISKVLFYTGPIADYTPGMDATLDIYPEQGNGSVHIENSLAQDVSNVIVLYRDTQSSCMDPSYCPVYDAKIAWAVIPTVAAQSSASYDVTYAEVTKAATEEDPYPSVNDLLPTGWTDLPGTLRAALGARGLTTSEQDVFMTAWTQSMLGLLGQDAFWYYPSYGNGAFLIYLWPDARAEELVPMTTVPAATEKVRALVEYQNIASQFVM